MLFFILLVAILRDLQRTVKIAKNVGAGPKKYLKKILGIVPRIFKFE